MNPTDVLKIYIDFFNITCLFGLIQTVRWGKKTKTCCLRDQERPLDKHKFYRLVMILSVVGIVIGVGVARLFIPELDHWSNLLKVHLGCDACFIVSIIGASAFNGRAVPSAHPKIVWGMCLPSTVAMIVTGYVLTTRLHGQLLPAGFGWF